MKSDLLDSLFWLFSYPNTFDVITPALCFLIGLTNLAQLYVKAGLFPASYMPCCLAAEAHIVADKYSHTHTHTQPFYGPFSGTTRVSQCKKRTYCILYACVGLWLKPILRTTTSLSGTLNPTQSINAALLNIASVFLMLTTRCACLDCHCCQIWWLSKADPFCVN